MKKKNNEENCVLLWQGCFISILVVSYVQSSETVKHNDKLDKFKLNFLTIVINLRGVVRLHFRHFQYLS